MKLHAALLILTAAAACNREPPTSTTRTTGATVHAPDNTATSARDDRDSITPLDHGTSQDDIDTTQAIRNAVMADNTLSVDAKNVKIMTNGGVVTLRGPVTSFDEKMNVEAKATALASHCRVDDLLDVEPIR
jgi:hyperosmotically inducible periplasmic protein